MTEYSEVFERIVEEIDVLNVVYNDIDTIVNEHDNNPSQSLSSSCYFKVMSLDEVEQIRSVVNENEKDLMLHEGLYNNLNVNLEFQTIICEGNVRGKLCFTLRKGYLVDTPATVSVISIGDLNRSKRDTISGILNSEADELVGSEAIMTLIQRFQEISEEYVQPELQENSSEVNENVESPNKFFSRRWIWVHHITNQGRIKDIVREAKGLSLNGYLKSGYPGICVIEGTYGACDEFVQWIKGSKSCEGGFGRNWGHHVRGEIRITSEEQLKLRDLNFESVSNEDMSNLAASCKKYGIEDEFLCYVMQHTS